MEPATSWFLEGFISTESQWELLFFILFYFAFFFFLSLRAAPVAYGGFQARGPVRIVAAGLCQSHSNVGSEPYLQPIPQLMAILNP